MKAVVIALACLMVMSAACAQTYKIDWYCISSGGGEVAGGAYKLNSTVGQPAAGFVQGTSLLHWIGFWAAETPVPTVCDNVGDAKTHSDGTLVSVAGKVATSAIGDYAGFFYVEEPDRSSGIRVAIAPGNVAGLVRGSVVNVIGTLGTTSDDERQLTGPMVIIVSTTTPLNPLGMPNRSIGGGDMGIPPLGQFGVTGVSGLNNIGLLVTTWGRVSYLPGDVLVIDDGSGVMVRIDMSTLSSPPASGSYVAVTGVSSLLQASGARYRLVMPRDDADVVAP